MQNKTKLTLLGILLFLGSCTSNQMAKDFGGTEELKLPENQILLNMTWKDQNLWILTQDTITNISYFREKSNWGVLEGAIIVK